MGLNLEVESPSLQPRAREEVEAGNQAEANVLIQPQLPRG